MVHPSSSHTPHVLHTQWSVSFPHLHPRSQHPTPTPSFLSFLLLILKSLSLIPVLRLSLAHHNTTKKSVWEMMQLFLSCSYIHSASSVLHPRSKAQRLGLLIFNCPHAQTWKGGVDFPVWFWKRSCPRGAGSAAPHPLPGQE